MEEVDNIIIESLRNINCQIDEDVVNLKQFTPDIIADAFSCCLESIKPGANHPKRLPASMSLRIKVASDLAEQIQNLGFRGDMGYQTILYCNEIEVRRVLMYLIERLPRESNKTVCTEELGYVPTLVKQIEAKMRDCLQTQWFPSQYLYQGAHLTSPNQFFLQSTGCSIPLHTKNLHIPHIDLNSTDSYRDYCVRTLPDVTRQCSADNLLASLLFTDTSNTADFFNFNKTALDFNEINKDVDVKNLIRMDSYVTASVKEDSALSEVEIKVKTALSEFERSRGELATLQSEVSQLNEEIENVSKVKLEVEDNLKKSMDKYNIKSKTLTILSKEENLEKLKTLIETGNERLMNLAQQWQEVQSPLLEEYTTLQNSLSDHELRLKTEQEKIRCIITKRQELENSLIEKERLESALITECQNLNKNTNRSSYTKRILEIIGNIKKQNGEINKILKDTKEVQKEINSLNGQLSRSFTLSDELIFRDAKYDEMSRQSYKLLATLHEDCSHVVQSVTDLGNLERDSRNLQEQLDIEQGKETAAKLNRVYADLIEVRKEIKQSSVAVNNGNNGSVDV